MEEFTQEPVGDAAILDRETKLTVAPVHEQLGVDGERSAAEIGNAQANGPAIGNFEGDIESTRDDTDKTVPTQSAHQRAEELLAMHKAATPPTKSIKTLISIIVVSVMIGLLLFFLLYR